MLQNARVTAFTISELLGENFLWGGVLNWEFPTKANEFKRPLTNPLQLT